MLQYYKDFDNRILWIDFEISDNSINVVKAIHAWNHEDSDKSIPASERKPIIMMINSPGGNLYETFSIIDAIRMSETPVYTVAYGKAFSGAFMILIAGHKRYSMPHSFGMHHSLSAGMGGDLIKIKNAARQFDLLEKKSCDLLYSTTKITKKVLSSKKADDWYMDASEMLNYGVIDAVIENKEDYAKIFM